MRDDAAVAACGTLEFRPRATSQPQRIGKQANGISIWPARAATLYITDGSDAEAGQGSELFLRQPGGHSVLVQDSAKPPCGFVLHRPAAPLVRFLGMDR